MTRCFLWFFGALVLLVGCGGPDAETWDAPAVEAGGNPDHLHWDPRGEVSPEQRLFVLLLQGRGLALDGFASDAAGLDVFDVEEQVGDSSPDPMPRKLRDEPMGSRMN